MSKTILFFLLLGFCFSLHGHAQDICNWINQQYIPSNVNDYDNYAIHTLNGNVRSIDEEVTIKNTTEKELKIQTQTTFLFNGKPTVSTQYFADGSISKTWFFYTILEEPSYQKWLYLFNSGTSLDTIHCDSLTLTTGIPQPDSVVYNQKGETTYFKLNSDEVFSFYDEFGRKTRDSVASYQKFDHEITYRYTGRKVVRKTSYADSNFNTKTHFWIDHKGNWTKCIIKSGHQTTSDIKRKISYF